MVDMDRVLGEIKRTTYVGLGSFASSYVGNFLDDFIPGGNAGVGAAQMLAGAGAAAYIGGSRGGSMTSGLDFDTNEMIRHVGYGVGGAGFADIANALNNDALLSGQYGQSEMVEVRTRSNASQHTPSHNSTDTSQTVAEEVSVDV